jgi:hypothetical protein
MDDRVRHQAECVGDNVKLAALDLLSSMIPCLIRQGMTRSLRSTDHAPSTKDTSSLMDGTTSRVWPDVINTMSPSLAPVISR